MSVLTVENQNKNFITREMTNVIKGIALLFMFFHHFFTFPEWHESYITYSFDKFFTDYLCFPLKICVPIFAFLSGYFYFYNKNKTYTYSLKKMTNIWINYIFIFIPLLIVAVCLGTYKWSVTNFILEFLGDSGQVGFFCWYVWFYFAIMLLLPIFAKIDDKNLFFGIAFGIFLPIIFYGVFVKFVHVNIPVVSNVLGYLNKWFAVVITGYYFAKYNLFVKLFDRVFKDGVNKVLFYIINFGLIVISLFGRQFCPIITYKLSLNLDVIWAPLFIYAVVNFFNLGKKNIVAKPIGVIGKYSLNMWFVHSLFFNCCTKYTLKLLYFPKNIVLVYMWGVAVCFAVAFLIDFPIKKVTGFVNKIFDKRLKKS